MSNRTLFYLIISVVVVMGLLFIFNIISMIWNPNPEVYVSHNDVRGMAVQYHGKLFTLDFKQQNQTIDYLNRALPVSPQAPDSLTKPDIEKIVIYRFLGLPEIEIAPINLDRNGNYIFSAPLISPTSYLQDISQGDLFNLLSQTYDKE